MTATTVKTSRRKPVPAPEAAASSSTTLAAIRDGGPAAGQVLECDPTTLTLDANTRKDVALTAEFKADVAANGVVVPLMARLDPLGQVLVWDGQRRLLAAVEAGLPMVRVVITEPLGDEEERVTTQDRVNHHRTGLTVVDQAAVFEQLAAFGRSPESIARKLNRPVTEVEAGLAIAASSAARDAVAQVPEMTTVQAAAIAEFDDDPEAVASLVGTLDRNPGQFPHIAQRLRDDRERAAVVAAHAAELEAVGVRVLAERPAYNDTSTLRLSELASEPGGKEFKPKEHASCPGHAVVVQAFRSGGDGWRADATYFCTEWKKVGHFNRFASASAGATAGPQSEEQKAERRLVVENNKASDAAVEVRHAWLLEFFQRKAMPADAVQAAAELFILSYGSRRGEESLQAEVLGARRNVPSKAEAAATPHQATAWLLAWAVGRVESGMRGTQGPQLLAHTRQGPDRLPEAHRVLGVPAVRAGAVPRGAKEAQP